MKILTAAQMRDIDRITIEELGMPSLTLMENAGVRFVEVLEARFAPLAKQRIAILCGKGNNGGDGFVIARQLWMRHGIHPRVVLLGDPNTLRSDAAVNYNYLTRIGWEPRVVPDLEHWIIAKQELLDSTLLIDAILGTGLQRPLEGFALDIVSDVNSAFAHVPIVAVDIPTGLPSDTGDYFGEAVRATLTVTFTAPKISQIFPPNRDCVGELVVRTIGTPPELLLERPDFFLNLLEPSDVAPLLQRRMPDAHKGDFGHVLLIAGSRGKTGAAALAGRAALQAGAGLVTVATAESALPMIAASMPELMTEALPETDTGSISTRAFDYGLLEKIAAGKTLLAIGPGLSQHPDTVAFVRRVMREFPGPMVLDADALNALAGATELLDGRDRVMVITPHPGEMARLAGVANSDVQSRRVETARAMAMGHHIYVVLKGHGTLIAEPGGQVFVCTTGNPGMATAGMGDTLTGIMAAFLAQFAGHPPAQVISAAVYLHGLAGDLAAAELGEIPVIASDIMRFFPPALKLAR
jgi:ADP-dependent NAD(P)H-hydrate dehydratase / NAD(P)H-hydrate epimerase